MRRNAKCPSEDGVLRIHCVPRLVNIGTTLRPGPRSVSTLAHIQAGETITFRPTRNPERKYLT